MVGSLLTRAAACVNCSRDSTIRGMREVGGLIVRRECSHSKGSARFARSLAAGLIRIARDTHDLRRVALPDLVMLRSSDLSPCQINNTLVLLQIVNSMNQSGQVVARLEIRESCLTLCYILSPDKVREII